MKKIILFISLALFCSAIRAQTSSTEAKAAYILAEEAFAANDWKGTLSYLDECKSNLGTANSKILYLQLMAEMELAKTKPEYYDKAIKTISAFQNAPDVKDFNEEKVLEVMKFKLRIKDIRVKAEENIKQEQQNKEKGALLFSNWTWQDWPLSVSYGEVKALKKNDEFFKVVWETRKDRKTGLKLAYTPTFKLPRTLKSMYLIEDKVVGYTALLGYYASEAASKKVLQYPNYTSGNEARQAFQQHADSLTSLFGFKPQRRTPINSYFPGTAENEYYWMRENKTVSLLYYTERNGSSFIYLEVKVSDPTMED